MNINHIKRQFEKVVHNVCCQIYDTYDMEMTYSVPVIFEVNVIEFILADDLRETVWLHEKKVGNPRTKTLPKYPR